MIHSTFSINLVMHLPRLSSFQDPKSCFPCLRYSRTHSAVNQGYCSIRLANTHALVEFNLSREIYSLATSQQSSEMVTVLGIDRVCCSSWQLQGWNVAPISDYKKKVLPGIRMTMALSSSLRLHFATLRITVGTNWNQHLQHMSVLACMPYGTFNLTEVVLELLQLHL